MDQGSEFRGVFLEWASAEGIMLRLTATEAHWQLGVVERRVLMIREMHRKVFDELDVRGVDAVVSAVNAMTESINRHSYQHGFTPAQWVLGHQPVLPGALSEIPSLAEHNAALQEGSFLAKATPTAGS